MQDTFATIRLLWFTVKNVLSKICTLIFKDQIDSIIFLHWCNWGSFRMKEFIELLWPTSVGNKMVQMRVRGPVKTQLSKHSRNM
jgi:hypothetical protein